MAGPATPRAETGPAVEAEPVTGRRPLEEEAAPATPKVPRLEIPGDAQSPLLSLGDAAVAAEAPAVGSWQAEDVPVPPAREDGELEAIG